MRERNKWTIRAESEAELRGRSLWPFGGGRALLDDQLVCSILHQIAGQLQSDPLPFLCALRLDSGGRNFKQMGGDLCAGSMSELQE